MLGHSFPTRRSSDLGHTDYWKVPIHLSAVGNTFIDGPSLINFTASPIARQKPFEGTQVYQADNVFNPGDRPSPAPLVDPNLAPYLVTADPTDQEHGLKGFKPLPAAESFAAVLADYLKYVRDEANGYVSVAFPHGDGVELSCRA